ncbi:MAG TPA: hypothetical protein ENI92_02165 [Bacteroidetes bacterium]|nr:hypothetical protein [Bacteroidota bacterium]
MSEEFRITSKICMTKDVGTHGNLFGGNMLAWMDEAAAVFARTRTGEPHLVTLRFSEILFKRPVKVGEMITFYACEPVVGRSSITFDLVGKVKEDVVFRTTCTFVNVDAEGRAKPIPGR